MSKVILIGGLPGTGKSTLAERLADHLGLPLFAKDRLEAAVLNSGLVTADGLNGVGYRLLDALVRDHQTRDQSVIIDFIGHRCRVDQHWPEFHDLDVVGLECFCSDAAVHRHRLENRTRHIPGWYELTWADAERARQSYVPLMAYACRLDSMDSIAENLESAVRFVSASLKD